LAQGTNYKVRVTADDGKGNTAQAVSAAPFGVATAPVTFAGAFGTLLSNRCGACHNGGGPNAGAFQDDNYALATVGVKDQTANIKADVGNNKMPPNAPLAAADKDVVTLWIWSGAQ
jgi:mono/diheme cytochrome c family protein